MRLFFKEHALLIAVQLIQFLVIFAVYWLGGSRNLLLGLYSIFLGVFFLACYLIYQYVSRSRFYKKLCTELADMEAVLEPSGRAPVAVALDQVLKDQYRLYTKQITEAEERQEGHLEFMDRWVHQMKTPLSVIELTAQNLDEPDSSSIREETEQLQRGLNTVLYMARLRTIEKDFHIKPVELSKLIQEVNMEHRRYYIRSGVYPQFSESRAGITVETDEKWLFFILSQLIYNAVKYSAGKSDHIQLSVYERGGFAILEVSDEGIGIPPADRKRIYHKFFTGSNGRKYRESTGMGLYLVKEVCTYLGHGIEMESEVGKGTVFRIVFKPSQNLTGM